MSWRKYFTPVPTDTSLSVISGSGSVSKAGPARTNYSSYLPDVYLGSPNRVDRYQQYEVMDSDPEINAALDILAEFCTQKLKDNKSPFAVKWRHKATNSEVRILAEYLQQWNKLQQFDTRIFRIVRNVFKYGDSFFIRDPETQKWHWIDPSKIVKVIVNESDGKKPEQYVIKDLAPNFEDLVVTQITPNINPRQTSGGIGSSPGYFGATGMQRGTSGPYPSASSGSRFGLSETEYAIDAEHIVHLSLSEGLDNNYPFGNSLLENIFKVYKQKELLEDAILIYRIQRAPERRVFHIDVGNMPTHMAMAFVERVKTEIHQRRIPSQAGGGMNVIDSAYSPLGINEDYFFPKTCLALTEQIKLLDDRDLTLADIIKEYNEGKENYVYTFNQTTHEVEPGKIVWAGVTRKNAQLIEITLDNDKKIKVTPDHRFIMQDGSEVEAQDLKEKDLLASLDDLIAINDIKYLDIFEDTGDITVESINDNHNFALTVGVFIHNSEGRGSDVTTLPGGSQLGEIDDLRFFTNKLFRGLRIPSSYLPTGAEDSQTAFNDGRVGTAYIQELRFNKYCERLQTLITEVFDTEFKMYMYTRGLNIDSNLFELQFNPPMNFASSRQVTIDAERINTFNTIQAIPFMSNRFALKRFLGLTDEELAENERLWAEENGQGQPTHTDAAGELRGAGLSAGGITGDLGMAGDLSAPEDLASQGELGAEDIGQTPPVTPATTTGTPPTI